MEMSQPYNNPNDTIISLNRQLENLTSENNRLTDEISILRYRLMEFEQAKSEQAKSEQAKHATETLKKNFGIVEIKRDTIDTLTISKADEMIKALNPDK